VEERRRIVVGVNAFREDSTMTTPVLEVDPAIERDQIARLQAFRASRDGAKVAAARAAVERDAHEDRNLMPGLIDAVRAGTTLGEVVATLKTVYGEQPAGRS
jgi:methylmalonyl-CoA mutase N-terminal domain/subunit